VRNLVLTPTGDKFRASSALTYWIFPRWQNNLRRSRLFANFIKIDAFATSQKSLRKAQGERNNLPDLTFVLSLSQEGFLPFRNFIAN